MHEVLRASNRGRRCPASRCRERSTAGKRCFASLLKNPARGLAPECVKSFRMWPAVIDERPPPPSHPPETTHQHTSQSATTRHLRAKFRVASQRRRSGKKVDERKNVMLPRHGG
uniref:Uncharacterized protein n=1 Tax=Noctiluca scintillans TaxID=2966 RepID=A0A7S1FD43_NOCSC